MTNKVKQTVKAYLAERPSVRVGMKWDSEGFIFLAQNSHTLYAIFVKRSEVVKVLDKLTVVGEDCSEKSGGGWHLRVNGAKAIFNWAMAQTNGNDNVKGRIEPLCTEEEWFAKIDEYQALHGHKAKNAGRTGEWVCEEHFEGSTINQHNDRKNDNESDITMADGTVWEIKTIAYKSRAQIKVQD